MHGRAEGRPQLNYARLPIHLPCRPIAHTHGTNWWTRPVPFSSHNSSFSLPSSFLTGPTSNLIHRIAPPPRGRGGRDTWPPMKWELTKWGGCQTHKREGNLLQTRVRRSNRRRVVLALWAGGLITVSCNGEEVSKQLSEKREEETRGARGEEGKIE